MASSKGYRILGLLAVLLLAGVGALRAQDIEKIAETPFLKVNGGVAVNQTFYAANGIENRRDPYFWLVNANLNLDFLGIVQAPFSFSFSQQDKNFSQPEPFNRFGLSPRYRAVTLHLGHRSMRFSDYTLGGNIFFGAGVEVKPKDSFFRFSAMYGRLTKPVARQSTQGLVFARPAFRRIGYGMKLGMGRNEDHAVDLILFRAFDDINSIPITDSLSITPEENVVFGFNTNQKISPVLKLNMEYAFSMLTRNRTLPETSINNFSFANNLGSLFTANLSSEFNKAIKSSLDYSGEHFNLNLAYRRVDPGYRTLGSTFLNNDLEDISAGISFQLAQGIVGLSSNVGVQRNNLNGQLIEQVRRVIYSFGTSLNPSQKLNLNLNYSNFNSETTQSLIQTDILVDSLEFFQVTQNGTINVNYNFGSQTAQKSLFVTGSIQDATDNQQTNTTFYNVNSGLQMQPLPNLKTVLSFTYNRNETEPAINTTYGPVLSLGRNLFQNKVTTSLSVNFLSNILNGEQVGQTKSIRFNSNMKVSQKQSLALSVFYVNSERSTDAEQVKFSEIRGSLNYSYRF